MQTILGSGGAVGIELARNLASYTDEIRLVSRNPKKVNSNDELFPADLLQKQELDHAIRGSDIVYITIGFEYKTSVWKKNWPIFMENVIAACIKENAKLVFFDNTYMYDVDCLDNITELSTMNPSSEKGKIRDQVAQMVLDEIAQGGLKALIARSADFYGPSIDKTSMLTETVFNNLKQGKKANWMISTAYKHSMTYIPDAAKATALLGNTESAYGEVWHLPTADNPPTGKEWVAMIAEEMNVKPMIQVVPRWLVKVLGWFIPIMGEMYEMLYQYDRNYVFNTDKFDNQFKFRTTSYKEGIHNIVSKDYKGK